MLLSYSLSIYMLLYAEKSKRGENSAGNAYRRRNLEPTVLLVF